MRLVYVATRNLAPGHVLDDEQEIAAPHEDAQPIFTEYSQVGISLSRRREVDLEAIETEWELTTDHIEVGQALDNIEEFIHSVIGGVAFTFDPDSDDLGVDVSPISVKMVSTRFSRRRTTPRHYKYTFRFVQL